MRTFYVLAVAFTIGLGGCGGGNPDNMGDQAIQEGTGAVSDGGAENPGTAATGDGGAELNEAVESDSDQGGTGGP